MFRSYLKDRAKEIQKINTCENSILDSKRVPYNSNNTILDGAYGSTEHRIRGMANYNKRQEKALLLPVFSIRHGLQSSFEVVNLLKKCLTRSLACCEPKFR